MITKAILPIAGLGTRMLPATKAVAKELFPINCKPALLYLLEECLQSGITDVLLIISKEKKDIIRFFKDEKRLFERLQSEHKMQYLQDFIRIKQSLRISFAYQNPNVCGSGGALLAGKAWANGEDVAVLFGDDVMYTEPNQLPVTMQLLQAYNERKGLVVGCQYVTREDIVKYSSMCIVNPYKNWFEVNGIIEKPQNNPPSLLSGLGRYIVPNAMFSILKQQAKGCKGKEVGLTEAMHTYLQTNGGLAVVMEAQRYDIGDKLGLVRAQVEYALRDETIGEKVKNYIKSLKF